MSEMTLSLTDLSLAYRAEPNSQDILPKGIPHPETEFSESKLREVASAELQKTLPYLWRQVFPFQRLRA